MGLKATSRDLLACALKTTLNNNGLNDIRAERALEFSGVSQATFYNFYGK